MVMQTLKNFRTNLRAAMALRKFTQRSLADEAKISYPHLNRILMGTVNPSLLVAEGISRAVGFELKDLILPRKEFRENFLESEKVS